MPARDFLSMLSDLSDGDIVAQLDEALEKVAGAAMATKKSGGISLALKVKPEGGVAVVTAQVKTTVPQAATLSTIFYTDDEGHLFREDPRQQVLPLRIAPVAVDGGRVLTEILDNADQPAAKKE